MRANEFNQINEYNVIGSAVRMDEIPAVYRKLPFLGRGATTLAFEKDADTVLVFTRDAIKKDWLTHGLHMVSHYEIVNPVRAHHIPGMRDIALFMITMPKLFPLSAANRREVIKELKLWANMAGELRWGGGSREDLSKLLDRYENEYPNSLIVPFLDWLMDYNREQYQLDLGPRQFKQTAHGEIVLLDPVIDREVIDLLSQRRTSRFT